MIAERTGTKSPLGEAVDAVCDKLGVLAVLPTVAVQLIVPWWAFAVIVLRHAANSVIAAIGWRRKSAIRPVRSGKLSTLFEWTALAWFMLAKAYQNVPTWPAYVFLVPALVIGFVATAAYGKKLIPTVTNAAAK
jgi:phosphatidylglycerophosphate synthase